LGLLLVGFGIRQMLVGHTPNALNISLVIMGVVELATSHYALRRVRAAWSFALSLNGTAAIALLFSGPRIRDTAEVSILVALIPCVVFGLLVLLHALSPEEY
jgi:hypothetical protein